MRPISVHVADETYEGLKAEAAARNRPVAELIREAMELLLAQLRAQGSSLADLPVHDAGPMLGSFSREELYDEMLAP